MNKREAAEGPRFIEEAVAVTSTQGQVRSLGWVLLSRLSVGPWKLLDHRR